MRIRVEKPLEGHCRIILDDRRGITRKYLVLTEVPVETVKDAVGKALEPWSAAKLARKEAKRLRTG